MNLCGVDPKADICRNSSIQHMQYKVDFPFCYVIHRHSCFLIYSAVWSLGVNGDLAITSSNPPAKASLSQVLTSTLTIMSTTLNAFPRTEYIGDLIYDLTTKSRECVVNSYIHLSVD